MRFTFKDKATFNGTFNSGSVIHLVESKVRVDNEDNSELTITMTSCGQSSPSFNGHAFVKSSEEVTCKKCLKRSINKHWHTTSYNDILLS